MLAIAAAMGYAHVAIFRTWRVDKTWMQSRLRPRPTRAADPRPRARRRFQMPELPDSTASSRWSKMSCRGSTCPNCFVAHPNAATSTSEPSMDTPYTLAIDQTRLLALRSRHAAQRRLHPDHAGRTSARTEAALAACGASLTCSAGPRRRRRPNRDRRPAISARRHPIVIRWRCCGPAPTRVGSWCHLDGLPQPFLEGARRQQPNFARFGRVHRVAGRGQGDPSRR